MTDAPQSAGDKARKRHRPPKKSSVVRILRAFKRRYDVRKRRHQTEHQSNERMMARWTRNVGLFTLAAGFIGVITAGIFKWQLDAMQGQLQIMRMDQRPWVSLGVDIAGPLAHDSVDGEYGIRWHIPLKYRVENVGKTPALHVSFFAHILPTVSETKKMGFGRELDELCRFTENVKAIGFEWGEMLFPQEKWQERFFIVQGEEHLFTEAKKVVKQYPNLDFGQFLIATCVTYDDTFSDTEPYRTAKDFLLGKKNRDKISFEGETVALQDLALSPMRRGFLAR